LEHVLPSPLSPRLTSLLVPPSLPLQMVLLPLPLGRLLLL
jgi:hypothetical protein